MARSLFCISQLLLIALLAAGCATTRPHRSETSAAPAAPPSPLTPDPATAAPAAPATPRRAAPRPPAREDVAAARPAIEQLARHLRIPAESIQVLSVAPAEWPNTCLGLPADGEICGQMIVPGYAVSLLAEGHRYDYRTDLDGRRVRLALAPRPEVGEPLVTWRDARSFHMLIIGTRRIAFGRRGGPLIDTALGVPDRAHDLQQFLATYGPFEARTPAGEIVFAGVGEAEATPTVQRLIAEWAHMVWREADLGLTEPASDRAFIWSRRGVRGQGNCDRVAVSRTGIATAWSCRSGEDRLVARLAISEEQLARLYRWLDRFETVDFDATAPGMTDRVRIGITLAGDGVDVPTEADLEAMTLFANEIVTALLAAQGGDA
ncbi:MAG: hypothetical protein D6781_08160 [Verrucomicrobia bacterium]|nr:MAG: hypothetical protein D6781_08160 [Verrucomicrobiota bacterium]